MESNRTLEAAIGAILGDAAGAPLENLRSPPTQSEIQSALAMCGGGAHSTAPGQVTDDGEQTISQARGLIECGAEFDINKLAKSYVDWLNSMPFDAGMTTFDTIGAAARMTKNSHGQKFLDEHGYAKAMTNASEKFCMRSKSNGCLMRATPLGVWAHDCTDEEIAEFAHQDCALTNPNSVCKDAVAAYCIAIASLVSLPGDNMTAYQRAMSWVEANAVAELKEWKELVESGGVEPVYPHAGFIKIAWTHAFSHLKLGTSYREALTQVLTDGGDTDTNACIVGGMMGALWGESGIPEDMKQAVLTCDTSKGRPRPDFLSTSHIPQLASQLLSCKKKDNL